MHTFTAIKVWIFGPEMNSCLHEVPLLKASETGKGFTRLQTACDDRITPPHGDAR